MISQELSSLTPFKGSIYYLGGSVTSLRADQDMCAAWLAAIHIPFMALHRDGCAWISITGSELQRLHTVLLAVQVQSNVTSCCTMATNCGSLVLLVENDVVTYYYTVVLLTT